MKTVLFIFGCMVCSLASVSWYADYRNKEDLVKKYELMHQKEVSKFKSKMSK